MQNVLDAEQGVGFIIEELENAAASIFYD